jgi:NAD(P)-dependent dehydrogenase (short-subunit alcohol dehydrogenase family)
LARERISSSIPMQRLGRPNEVAQAISWLLSDKASLVTGAHLNVGGGGFMVAGWS